MKLWTIIVISSILLDLALTKQVDKITKKKNSSSKTKIGKQSSKASIENFKNLPSEDLEFIKELDKQFKLHGDKIKIKIERNNLTKTSKRTIDGELGYGYHPVQQRFQFSPPKYVIYPYSQKDIPSASSNYRTPYYSKTYVSIEPSQSFEINHPTSEYDSYTPTRHYHQAPVQQAYVEPVIVLRIPGPAKYASHLQALLQQYLEIRAAQYITSLQQSESGQYHHPSSYQQTEPQKQNHQVYYDESEPYQHQNQHSQFKPIEQVYRNVQYMTIPAQLPADEQPQQPEHQADYQEIDQPTQQEEQQHHQQYHPSDSNYNYQTLADKTESYGDDAYNEESVSRHTNYPTLNAYHSSKPKLSNHLQISENNPRSTHTKVIFTESDNSDHGQDQSYPLPSTKLAPKRYEPAPVDQHHQSYSVQHDDPDYQQQESFVSITQRPYNYHAHSLKDDLRNKKRDASTMHEELKNISKFISRLKKN